MPGGKDTTMGMELEGEEACFIMFPSDMTLAVAAGRLDESHGRGGTVPAVMPAVASAAAAQDPGEIL